MSDDSDPIAPPLESPKLDDIDPRADSGAIEGRVRDIDEGANRAAPPAPSSARPLALAGAALIGGLAGGGLLWFLNPPADPSPALKRIEALEGAAAKTGASYGALEKRVAALAADVAASAKSAPKPGDLQGSGERVGQIERTLGDGALTQKLEAPPAPDFSPALLALDARIALLERPPAPAADGAKPPDAPAQAPVDLGPLAGRIDALEQGVKALAAKPDALAPLAARVAALEGALAQAKSESRAAAEAAPPRDGASLALMAQALGARLEAGTPFAAELDTLKRLGAPMDLLSGLAPFAASGAPTLPSLLGAFDALAPGLAAAAAPPPASMGESVMATLAGLVRVKAQGIVEGDSPAALITQIRAALAKGDLAGSLAAFGKLPEKARAAGDAWRQSVQARVGASAALAKLQAAAYSALKPAAQ